MLRVGYPATFDAALLGAMPAEVELIVLADGLDRDVEIDVWIPDPYPTRAQRIWPRLRDVRLVLSLLAGTEWIEEVVGPDVTICNARGAHNVPTAEWTLTAILAMLKYLPLYLNVQASSDWRRRKEASAHYERMSGDVRHAHPAVMLEELTGKSVLLVGYGAIGQEIERMLAPFHVQMVRVARSKRTEPMVHAVSDLDTLLPAADIVVLILPLTAESKGLIGAR